MEHMTSEVFSLLSKALRQEVESFAWERATEIQTLAIPRILKGESVLLIAPTGTGKTEAAVYPIFEQYLRTRLKHPLNGISILYITPLRALNRDIFRRLIDTGERLGIEVQVRHGDTTQYARRKQALHWRWWWSLPPNSRAICHRCSSAALSSRRRNRPSRCPKTPQGWRCWRLG